MDHDRFIALPSRRPNGDGGEGKQLLSEATVGFRVLYATRMTTMHFERLDFFSEAGMFETEMSSNISVTKKFVESWVAPAGITASLSSFAL